MSCFKRRGCFNKPGSKGNEATWQTYEGYGGIEHNLVNRALKDMKA